MWRLQSWRASAVSLALAGVVFSAATRVAAQGTWQGLYLAGESAFKKGDYKTAEEKLRAALAASDVPPFKNRGPHMLVMSQIRGFIPEYYLAIMCFETNRPDEGLSFAAKAETYLDSKDQIDKLNAEKAAASKSNTPEPPVHPTATGDANANKTTATPPDVVKPPADPSAAAATHILDLLHSNHLSDAIRSRNAAAAGGAAGKPFDDAGRAVDQADFTAAMVQARQDLAAGRLPDARRGAAHARLLDVDTPQVALLDAEIAKAEQPAPVPSGSSTSARGGKPPAAAPTNAVTPPSPLPIAPSPVVVDAQRRGLRALLSGDYQIAVSALQSAAVDASAPRTRFYLACAEAGLALTEPDSAKRASLEADARRDWQAVAGSRPALAADLAYISPAILRTLGVTPN